MWTDREPGVEGHRWYNILLRLRDGSGEQDMQKSVRCGIAEAKSRAECGIIGAADGATADAERQAMIRERVRESAGFDQTGITPPVAIERHNRGKVTHKHNC